MSGKPDLGRRWFAANLDPTYSYQHVGGGFITNQRGLSFMLHGGTRLREIARLVFYLDALEASLTEQQVREAQEEANKSTERHTKNWSPRA